MWETLVGVVVGFVLSQGATHLRDAQASKQQRTSLANALLAELFSQAAWCSSAASEWNAYLRTARTVVIKGAEVAKHCPPPAPIFSASAGQLGTLGPAAVASIGVFYGDVESLRSRLERIAASGVGAVSPAEIGAVAGRLQGACRNGLGAVVKLNEIAEFPQMLGEPERMNRLMADLSLVANGKVLGVDD